MKIETTQTSEPWNEASFNEIIETRANERELLAAKALFAWVSSQSLEIVGGRGPIESVLYLQTKTKNKPVKPSHSSPGKIADTQVQLGFISTLFESKALHMAKTGNKGLCSA